MSLTGMSGAGGRRQSRKKKDVSGGRARFLRHVLVTINLIACVLFFSSLQEEASSLPPGNLRLFFYKSFSCSPSAFGRSGARPLHRNRGGKYWGASMASTVSNYFFSFLFCCSALVVPRGNDMHTSAVHPIHIPQTYRDGVKDKTRHFRGVVSQSNVTRDMT